MEKYKKISFNESCPKEFKCVGVYGIEIDKHLYVGSSKDIHKRITEHKKCLRVTKNENSKFLNAYIKYGINNSYYYIIEICDPSISILDLRKREEYWIKELKADLNICLTPTIQGKPDPLKLRNIQGKRVYRYDLEGNFIDEFISVSEAGRILNINSSFISQVARGNGAAKSVHGYRWSYDKIEKLPEYTNNSAKAKIREVFILNVITGEEFEFESFADAVRSLTPDCNNFNASCANLACAANRKGTFFANIFLAKSNKDEKYKLPTVEKSQYNIKLNKLYKDRNEACKELACTKWHLKFNTDVISLCRYARVKLRESGKLQLLDNPNPSHVETDERIND